MKPSAGCVVLNFERFKAIESISFKLLLFKHSIKVGDTEYWHTTGACTIRTLQIHTDSEVS